MNELQIAKEYAEKIITRFGIDTCSDEEEETVVNDLAKLLLVAHQVLKNYEFDRLQQEQTRQGLVEK